MGRKEKSKKYGRKEGIMHKITRLKREYRAHSGQEVIQNEQPGKNPYIAQSLNHKINNRTPNGT